MKTTPVLVVAVLAACAAAQKMGELAPGGGKFVAVFSTPSILGKERNGSSVRLACSSAGGRILSDWCSRRVCGRFRGRYHR